MSLVKPKGGSGSSHFATPCWIDFLANYAHFLSASDTGPHWHSALAFPIRAGWGYSRGGPSRVVAITVGFVNGLAVTCARAGSPRTDLHFVSINGGQSSSPACELDPELCNHDNPSCRSCSAFGSWVVSEQVPETRFWRNTGYGRPDCSRTLPSSPRLRKFLLDRMRTIRPTTL